MEYPPAFHLWMAEAGEISVAEQILRWAEQEPLAFAELQFRKLLLFWDWRDIPNNVALYGEGEVPGSRTKEEGGGEQSRRKKEYVCVAQLDRALGYGPRCRGFESSRARRRSPRNESSGDF